MLDGLSIDCWVHWAGVVKLESRNMRPGCQGQGSKGRWPWESGGGGNPHRRTQKGCQVETLCVFIGMRFFLRLRVWQRLVRTRTGSHSERGGAGFPASTPVRGPAKCGEVPDNSENLDNNERSKRKPNALCRTHDSQV